MDETLLQAGADKSGGASGPGAMLSILHLSGWRISNPTLVARILQTEGGSLKSRKTTDVSITKESPRHN
jgi:hypothetical protein